MQYFSSLLGIFSKFLKIAVILFIVAAILVFFTRVPVLLLKKHDKQ